jgi:hypothetical protein
MDPPPFLVRVHLAPPKLNCNGMVFQIPNENFGSEITPKRSIQKIILTEALPFLLSFF